MAARPPGGGGTTEPTAIEFGIAALSARLEEANVSFPATDEEILEAISDQSIPYDSKGRTLELESVLGAVPESTYESETQLLEAVYPVFDEARGGGGGLLSRLRNVLPI